jgi:hypothetical protein
MKTKFFVSFIVFITTIIFSTTFSFAMFIGKASIKGFSFSTGVWSAPNAPILESPENNSLSNSDQIFAWLKPSHIYFEPETYSLEIYNSDPFLAVQPYIVADNIPDLKYPVIGKISLEDGDYYWRVKTVDAHGSSSVWSVFRKLTIDKTSPLTIISVENSPRKLINEQIPFGNFEKYENTVDLLEDYYIGGNINLWKSDDGYQNSSHEKNKMLRIGSLSSTVEGNNYLDNQFSFSFLNQSKTLSFYYNYFSDDEYPFDDPGFLLRINNEDVFKLNNLDIKNGNSTGWKQFFYDISKYEGVVTLDFFAGNNFDNFRQSWIYLDQISTGQVAINKQAKFYLETLDQDSNNKSYFCIDNCNEESNYSEYIGPFSIDLVKGDHILYFFSKDFLGNRESPQIKLIYFDNNSPQQVNDLNIKNISTDSAGLVFTAPSEDEATNSGKVAGYFGRISNEYIDSASSSSLLLDWWGRAAQFNANILPQDPGSLEEFNISNLLFGSNYFIGIKSFDSANNISEISNIININISPSPMMTPTTTPTPTETPTLTPSPTVTLTPTPINLIQNDSFEEETSAPWFYTDNAFTLLTTSEEKHRGNKSLRDSSTSNTYSRYAIQRILDIIPGNKYHIQAYVKKGSMFGGAKLRIGWYANSDGTQLSAKDSTEELLPGDPNEWKELNIEATAPLTATIMEVRLMTKTSGYISIAYFDDISVYEVNP